MYGEVKHVVEKTFDRLREMAEQTLSHVCKDLKLAKSRHAKNLAMVYNILVICEDNQRLRSKQPQLTQNTVMCQRLLKEIDN